MYLILEDDVAQSIRVFTLDTKVCVFESNQVVTDLLLNARQRVWVSQSSEVTIINYNVCPVSQFVWHAKKPSLRNDLKC